MRLAVSRRRPEWGKRTRSVNKGGRCTKPLDTAVQERDPKAPRVFRRLLTMWATSMAGDGVRMIAVPLLAKSLQPTAGAVAAVATAGALPWLLVAVPAGALVDRLNPVATVISAHLFRALCCAALVVAVLTEVASIPLLCVVAFAMTSAETFSDGASQSMMVQVIPSAHLERANSRYVVIEVVALDLIGPLAGGFTFRIAWWLPFLIAAAGFAVAALMMIGLLHRSFGRRPSAPAAASMISELRAGLRVLLADRVLRPLVLTVAVVAAAKEAQDAVQVIYATQTLGLSDRLYPTLFASYAVGTVVIAALVAPLSRRWPAGRVMIGALAVFGGGMLVLGLAPHPITAWISYFLMGAAAGTWNVLSASRRQRRTPRAMVARVSSSFRVMAWGMTPVGAAAGGVIGNQLSVPAVSVVGGAVVLLVLLAASRSLLRVEPDLGGADPVAAAPEPG